MPKNRVPVLAFAFGITALSNFLLSVVVGRSLGAAALGLFALAVAVSRVFYAVTDLGLSAHLTRIVARDPEASQQHASLFLTFRVAVIPAAIAVSMAVGLDSDSVVIFALVAVAQGAVSLQSLYQSLLLGHERQGTVGVLTIVSAGFVMLASTAWYLAGFGLALFATGYAVASVLGIVVWGGWTARNLGVVPKPRLSRLELTNQLGQSWPIGASNLLAIAALRTPVLVLSWYGSDADVGAFAAVDMFVTAGAVLQAAVSSATFPRLSSSYRNDPERFRSLFWSSNIALLLIGTAIAAVLACFGSTLGTLVFPGRDFALINDLMPIMGWSTPALLLIHHNILLFAAADNERTNVRIMGAWLVIIATTQLILVPQQGAIGAGLGLLIARGLGLALLIVLTFHRGIHRGGESHCLRS